MSRDFKVNVQLDEALRRIIGGTEHGVRLATEYLLGEANKHVPHDEGTLERSGEASAEGTRGAVSYDTPYAVRQHEDMTLSHDGKGKAKWLENTLATERGTIAQIIANTARGEVER